MTEKEMFLNTWQREFATTMKILRQLPSDKADFKPAAQKTRTAKDLAGVFIAEMNVVDGVAKGQIDFGNTSGFTPPASYADLLSTLESKQKEMVTKVKTLSETDWNSSMPFPVGPKQMGQVRKGDILWSMLMDSVHHRGQFSVYLRLVGAKVPSIYGPSADEPWM
ncbi:MAG TPA: DinB family protein [Bacteroidota bacterium]|nr:DinB family protein [Bacteroidota bacterium]